MLLPFVYLYSYVLHFLYLNLLFDLIEFYFFVFVLNTLNMNKSGKPEGVRYFK